MLWFSAFFVELFILFLLSRQLTRVLSYFFYRLTKSNKVTISLLAFLFFPGTVVHELAHAVAAGLMGVRVGTIEFVPKVEGDHVKLGSVQIAHTDPIRRFLIGAAPFFVGTGLLLSLLFFAVQHNWFANLAASIGIGYAVFEIGNTMFSSRKDMDGALELLVVVVTLIVIFYLLGIRVPAFNPNVILDQPLPQEVFKQGSFFLLLPLALDAIVIVLFRPHKR